MKSIIRITLILSFVIFNSQFVILHAQVAINSDGASPDASAMLDVTSSDKGMLVPRMTTSEREAISSPATGLLVYDTDENSFWYYESSKWIEIAKHEYTNTSFSPEYTNTVDVGNELNHMAQDGNYLYILDENLDDLFVYDLSTPSAPTLASSLSIANSEIRNIAVDGNYAYIVGTGTYDFHVIDISAPTNISLLGSHTLGDDYYTIEVSGGYAYILSENNQELQVIDISTPSSPSQVGDLTIDLSRTEERLATTLEGDNLYIGHETTKGWLTIIDISTPTSPFQVVSFVTSNTSTGSTNLIKKGDYIYQEPTVSVRTIDISTPSSPTILNTISNNTECFTIHNDYLFSDESSAYYEIDVFDISSPTAPSLLYTFDKPRSTLANAMLVYEGYLFTAESDGNLDIYKVSEPYYVNALESDGSIGTYPLYDDLGNHVATENLRLLGNWLTHDGDDEGVSISDDGNTTLSGTLTIGQSYTLPSTDGSASQVLSTDGSGTLSWVVQNDTLLSDADGDTKIQVEESSNEDIIRFDLGGTEYFTFKNGRINVLNTGSSVFLGENAGESDDLNSNNNVFIGNYAGTDNTSGQYNVFLGSLAGYRHLTGNDNIFIGAEAGWGNLYGENNIFIGDNAGFYEQNSNRLYIESSSSDFPLIYGEFDNDILRVNGTFQIRGTDSTAYYAFPLIDGSANQTLTTDGNGTLSWTDGLPTNYTFPTSDGNSNQYLTTNGSGTLSWTTLSENLGDHTATQNIILDDNWLSNDGGNEGIKITDGGAVGIGTTPTNGKLEINGSVNKDLIDYTYVNNSNYDVVHIDYTVTNRAISVYASDRIVGKYVISLSDERIKDIQGISDSKKDLDILNQIEITDYEFIDKVREGNTKQKKVIAQQVAEVFPQAVEKQITEIIPDIYQTATMDENGWVVFENYELGITNYELKVGEKVQILFDDKKELLEVLEVNENAFRVKQQATVNRQQATPVSSTGQAVFVYGRQVHDFHTVDYQAISMLNVSATQQLAKKVEQLKRENEQLKTQLQTVNQLEQQNAEMKAMLEQIQAQLNNQ